MSRYLRIRDAASKVRRLTTRLSLRARLLLGLIFVAALGFVIADTVVYHEIDSYLVTQVDQELVSTNASVGSPIGLRQGVSVPPGTWAFLVTAGGVQQEEQTRLAGPEPRVPANLATSASFNQNGVYVTTSAVGDASYSYRLFALPAGRFDPSGAVVIVALPLQGLNGTLHQLLLVDIAVSLGVLAILAGLGYIVVRVGMRPLGAIEGTAESIAAGDLAQRVENDDSHTEVGRLGASLNAMLAQIEHAFSEQQASEDRLRQFLADASHELRTPVTSIRGYSELFRRGAASRPEDLALAMRRIEDESSRMGILVDDLLLLARLDQGRPLEKAPVDLAAIATDATADAEVLAPNRPMSVDAPAPVLVIGDEPRLRQVVTNLVNNALRHTDERVPIEVRVFAADDRAMLVVRDEGPGIAKEHVERIFERFYRADPSRTRGSGGSGLGLAIVASIAKAHGGSARVDTEIGHGATFIVELPLASKSAPDVTSHGSLAVLAGPLPHGALHVGDEMRQGVASSGDASVGDSSQVPSKD